MGNSILGLISIKDLLRSGMEWRTKDLKNCVQQVLGQNINLALRYSSMTESKKKVICQEYFVDIGGSS